MQRIPHDPEYVARLGAAVYAYAYTEWLIFEVVRLADPTLSIANLVTMHARDIASALRRGLGKRDIDSDIPDRWEAVVQARHDIVHAHPATDAVEGQRLYRWRPERAHFVSNERLTEFITEVEQLNSDADDLSIALRVAPVTATGEPDRSERPSVVT
jgi:hypothetical protein